MALTYENVKQLIELLKVDAELRDAFAQALLPSITISIQLPAQQEILKRLDRVENEVAKLRTEMNEGFERVDQRFEQIDQRFERVDQRFESLEGRVERLATDVGMIKGEQREMFYRTWAASIFGLWLKSHRDGIHEIWDRLADAVLQGRITREEVHRLREADLLWLGIVRHGPFAGQEVLLVGEMSWTVSQRDVERALERAAIARKAGFWAVPFAGGKEWWDKPLKQFALTQGVICAEDTSIEPDDWNDLLARWKP